LHIGQARISIKSRFIGCIIAYNQKLNCDT